MPRVSEILSVVTAAVVLSVLATPSIVWAEPVVSTVAGVPLREVVAALPLADEVRDGYDRAKFRHWVDADGDGCNTRAEVLVAEVSSSAAVGPKCVITGGVWYSAYDDVYVTSARASDIDHMVPLAEAWDSGAFNWTSQQREAYANDLDESRALIAVTAATNRSKADQDPHEWLPPYQPAWCEYINAWTIVKTRWNLTVDSAEKTTLTDLAGRCPNLPFTVTPAASASSSTLSQ